MATENISGREHGKGHVTVTTVRCNCSNGTDTLQVGIGQTLCSFEHVSCLLQFLAKYDNVLNCSEIFFPRPILDNQDASSSTARESTFGWHDSMFINPAAQQVTINLTNLAATYATGNLRRLSTIQK